MLLAGCSSPNPGKELPSPAVGELADKLVQATTFEDELMEINSDVIGNLYEIDDEAIAEHKVYASSSGSTAEEIAVFKAANEESVSYVETMIQARVQDLKINFQDYVPAEMAKINSAVTLKKGLYVALIIANDPKPAEKAFNEAFKN